MRFVFLISSLILIAGGCNSDPRCRRETALLRAEILDLEDKYFLTKAQRDEALAALHGQGKSDIAAKIDRRSPPDPVAGSQEIHHGDLIYEGEAYVDGATLIDGATPIDGPYSDSPDNHFQDQSSFYDEYELPLRPSTGTPTESTRGSESPSQSSSTSSSGSQFRQSRPPNSSRARPIGSSQDTNSDSSFEQENSHDDRGAASPESAVNATRTSQPRETSLPISSADSIAEILIDQDRSGFQIGDTQENELVLFLRTRDDRGGVAQGRGTVTVNVADTAAPAGQQRLGSWKFLPEETELFLAGRPPHSGILLNLPLEGTATQGEDVTVSVRFQTVDGRTLETTTRIPHDKTVNQPAPLQTQTDRVDLVAEGRGDAVNKTGDRRGSPTPGTSSGPSWRPIR